MEITNIEPSSASFYPNPAQENISINGLVTATPYSIYDINGKLIKTGTTVNTINLESITKGFYFLTIGNNLAKKLIVE
jgi:hypothetical protein